MTKEEFKELRLKMGLSVSELASQLGLSKKNGATKVREMESGKEWITGVMENSIKLLFELNAANNKIEELREHIQFYKNFYE